MFGILCAEKKKKPQAASLPSDQQIPNRDAKMKFRYANGDQPLAGFTIKRGVGVGGFGEVYFAINDAGKEGCAEADSAQLGRRSPRGSPMHEPEASQFDRSV